MFSRTLKRIAFSAAALAFAGSAHATLLDGKTVSFTYYYPTVSAVYGSPADGNYVVGAGIEIGNGYCCGYEGTLDISDNNLLLDYKADGTYTDSQFNGFRISDVFGTIAPFTSVTINAITNMAGLNDARITFDADNIWVNWAGLTFAPDTLVSLDVATDTADVPEPGSLALAAAGLLAFGLRRRKN